MGFGGISTWQLVILLLIIILIFGTRHIRKIGGDLGAALKGFRKGFNDSEEEDRAEPDQIDADKPAAARSEESVKPSERP